VRPIAQAAVPKPASERAELDGELSERKDGYVRGGLDDALDKLARRDELRRRTAGEATGTPPAVQELVEAIAAVVGRNPKLAVTVGVEGAGEPTLLHFAVDDGIVQVTADPTVASRVAEAEPTSPRHADFDIDAEEPVDDPAYSYPAPAYTAPVDDQETTRLRYGYDTSPFAEESLFADSPYEGQRRFGPAEPERHPFAATPPPPVPPQTRRIHAEQHRAPEEPSAAERGIPTPLPQPIPLKVDSEQTEMAARRLAALLRDNPTLLRQSPQD
jgi:hypothetical protein